MVTQRMTRTQATRTFSVFGVQWGFVEKYRNSFAYGCVCHRLPPQAHRGVTELHRGAYVSDGRMPFSTTLSTLRASMPLATPGYPLWLGAVTTTTINNN